MGFESSKAMHEKAMKDAFDRITDSSQKVRLVPLSIGQMKAVSGFIWRYIGELPLPDKKHDAEMLLDAMKTIDDVIEACERGSSNG